MPLLPVHQEPKSVEYSPIGDGDGEPTPWAIEDWPGLSKLFAISEHELPAWHLALAGQGRPWLVIRRIHRVSPLWGDLCSEDDIKTWSWADLSKLLAVPAGHLKTDLAAAVEFWNKARLSASIQRRSPDSSDKGPDGFVKQLDGLPDFQIHQEFADDQIAAILTPFRFQSIRSASDRLYVANRILELRKLLEDKQTRESARTLIVMELNMASHESAIHAYKQRLEQLQQSREISKDQASEILKLGEALTSTEKALTSLSTTYRSAAADLGSDESEAGEQRRVAIGTISHLTEAHRRFYESGDRSLIDGMFTAEELVWLTTPLTIRPAQYRPDVVLRMREAMIPENLWGKDYQPTVIQREACRRMLKLSQLLAEEIQPPNIPEIDTDDSDDSSSDPDAPLDPHLPSGPPILPDYIAPEPLAEAFAMAIG